jgi:hypothetical protein
MWDTLFGLRKWKPVKFIEELQIPVAITVIQRKAYEWAYRFDGRLRSALDHESYGQQSTATYCDVYARC